MRENTSLQADSPGRRAAAYWFIDGLPEIAFGLAYLVWGVLGMAWGFHRPNLWYKWATIAAAVGFLVLFVRDRKVLDWLKARLTYPRTGYVRPPSETKPQPYDPLITLSNPARVDENVTFFRIRGVWTFFLAMALINLFEGARWSVAVMMIAAAILEYHMNREEVHRYSWRTMLPIVPAGILAAFLDLPPHSRQFIPLVIGGVWLLSHGTWTLMRYLHAHPKRRDLESSEL
jgi:hypothetical protein